MSKWLVITEKPSVAGDLAKALGGFDKQKEFYESDHYYITWAVGHMLEFLEPDELDPKYKRWALQDLPILPETFMYKPKKGMSERLKLMASLAKRKDVAGLVNACDAGREGELIFREIYDYCNIQKPFQRLWLQSMTPQAIKKEFHSLKPGQDYNPLGDAARCRSESDWLIGMNATRAVTRRLQTKSMKTAWSIGRVQTPTLALLVKRELEILKHRPEPYFTLEGQFDVPTHGYTGTWFDPKFKRPVRSEEANEDEANVREKDDRIFSKEKLESILKDITLHKQSATAQETRKESKEIAPQLFDLTLLQREANRRFGMSASRTLQAAQRLYEKHKLLTYPRTDSRYLPEDYVDNVQQVLKNFAADFKDYASVCKDVLKAGLLNRDRVFNNKHVSDHFAIIPTGQTPSGLEGDDERIFQLVVRRFIAAFMSHAVWAKVERTTQVGESFFRTKAQTLQVPGWRAVYGLEAEEDDKKLPPLADKPDTKVAVGVSHVNTLEAQTKPLPRLTEARLLSLMEHCGRSVSDEEWADALKDKGIGTPATRADIIENLINKEYALRAGKALKPTTKGIRLMDILNRIPVDALSKVELTGEMEAELRQMEKGQKKRSQFMAHMAEFTTDIVQKLKDFQYENLYASEEPLGKCPLCKKGQLRETVWGYQCTHGAEDCKFIVWKEKNSRYIDRTLAKELLEKRVAGPFEMWNQQGTAATEEYMTIVPEKGLVLCSESGEPKESVFSNTNAPVLHEEELAQTFLGIPGTLRMTENAYFCEFSAAATPKPVKEKPVKESKKSAKTPAKVKVVKEKKPPKPIISRMPRVLCGREMSLEDYKSFVTTGSTPPILDFKSKKGRTFGAMLLLKENGNFEFRFVKKEKEPKEAKDTVKKPRKIAVKK